MAGVLLDPVLLSLFSSHFILGLSMLTSTTNETGDFRCNWQIKNIKILNSQTSKTISGEATELQSCENGDERKFSETGGHRDDLFWQNINVSSNVILM